MGYSPQKVKVWNELQANQVVSGSFGKQIYDIKVDTTSILSDTGELQTDWANGGRLDLILDAIKLQTDLVVAGGATEANLEAVEAKIDTISTNIDTLVHRATADVGMSGSTSVITCADLADYGTDYFKNGWKMLIIHTTDGAAPENEIKDITAYETSSGSFTTAAFSQNVEANDYIMVARDEFFDPKTLLENATYGLNALHTDIAAIGGGTYSQVVFPTTIDLHQAAGAHDVATCGTADVIIKEIIISPRANVSDDANITYITVETDHTTVQTFINSTQGAKANLGDESQIAWIGSVLLKVGHKITFTIGGATATDDPTTVDVVITYIPTAAGGALA